MGKFTMVKFLIKVLAYVKSTVQIFIQSTAQMQRKRSCTHTEPSDTSSQIGKYIVFNPATRYRAVQTYSTIARNKLKIKLHSYILSIRYKQQAATQQA